MDMPVTKTVRNIMRTIEGCVLDTMTLDKVSDHLTKHGLTGAPVLDSSGNLVGFVSEHDCIKQLAQSSYYCDNTSLVEDVMTTKVLSVGPDISLIDLSSKMIENKINVAPVVEDQQIIGLVSRGDVMRKLVEDLENCNLPV